MIRRRQSPESACDHARALASAQLDGVLCEFDRHQLDAHLAACEGCGRVVAEMAIVAARVRSAEPVPMPVPAVVRAAGRRSRRRVGAPLRAAAAATALAAVATLGFVVATPGHHPNRSRPRPPIVAQQRFPIGFGQPRYWPQQGGAGTAGSGHHGFDV
jgi:anti-sigma factor RsiW